MRYDYVEQSFIKFLHVVASVRETRAVYKTSTAQLTEN